MAHTRDSVGTLTKPKREGIIKIKAESIKPPESQELPTGGYNYELVFVSNGREIKQKCTKEVFRRADGPPVPPGTDKMGRGLDFKTNSTFYIIKNPSRDGIIVAIDMQPENTTAKGPVSEEAKSKKDIVIRISPNGDLDVKQIPPGTPDVDLLLIMNQLDTLDTVTVGLIIGLRYEVTEVSGSTIHIAKIGAGE